MFILEYLTYFIEYIVRDPFTQISWFAAMWIILMAYFQKDDSTVKKLMLLSSLFWGTHFYLLWVYSWLTATIIFALRLCLSIKLWKNKNAFISLVIITLIAAYFTYDWYLSLLPVITSLTWAYSFFFLEKVQLRLVMMFNSSTWLVYHISIGSLSWAINEMLTQVILIVTVYRMLHPQGGSHYYIWKIKGFLREKSRPDYDRFIFVHDKVSFFRKKTWQHFSDLIHFDLRTLFNKKS